MATDAFGEQFLLRQDGDADKILIFATYENLHHLADAATIYVDVTFEICPSTFYQVFTINIFLFGQQFPIVYGLLTGKSRETYDRFFMAVKEAAMDRGVQIAPAEVMTDYELALVLSQTGKWLARLRGTPLKTCCFYLVCCMIRGCCAVEYLRVEILAVEWAW